MKDKPNILVCPLDWGIGHATRCVPVINELLHQNVHVIIAAGGRSLAFLRQEFPGLQIINFPGYRFSYPENGNMAMKMVLQTPAILKGIKQEKEILNQMITGYRIDGVISDSRFGLSSTRVPCVIISHQLRIKVPRYLSMMEPLLFRMNINYISAFDECWVPDFPDEPNLSGELSHIENLPSNVRFIGPLTRFIPPGNSFDPHKNGHEVLFLLSGPEPQRTIFEKIIFNQLKSFHLNGIMVRGLPELNPEVSTINNIVIHPHLYSNELAKIFQRSNLVVSRPGYSTLMDLAVFGNKAVFVPTPGQTEQEYLAKYCLEKKWFCAMNQKQFNLAEALIKAENFSGFARKPDPNFLKNIISEWLQSL